MDVSNKQVRFSLIYFLAVILLIFAIDRFFFSRELVTISYSEFKTLLREGLVNDLQISNAEVEGSLLQGAHNRILTIRNKKDEKEAQHLRETKVFSVVRIQDPDLVKELEQKGVRYTAKKESPWINTLVSWIVTMALFMAFWGFLLKRMGGAGGGLMTVGKSKAKVYVEGETKVTFADVAGVDEAEGELQEVIEFLQNP